MNIDFDSENQLKKLREEILTIVSEKTKSFPWLSAAIADYNKIRDNQVIDFLVTKRNPAYSAGEKVKEIALEKRVLTEQLLIARYRIKYYESLFPFLNEFNDAEIDEELIRVVNDFETKVVEDDPIKNYLTKGEYENLTVSERNQRALDRFLNSKKTTFQIGRDYERYIGYKYEQKGFNVTYHGIIEGLEDLGRDLICKKEKSQEVKEVVDYLKRKQLNEYL